MEKIWIQFKESDYQLYHDYCLRYYTVYDATRKRSIQLFLELFDNNRLSVGEHELGEVFSYFSNKCDEIRADHKLSGKNNSSPDLPHFQVCRDMLFLIEDFEKIYRLIQKKGITTNYLLILATFSKIIEEEKNAHISRINEQDRGKIESFAPDIADIIQARLGPDAGWESVLYELVRIVRKYNLASPDQQIDRNCVILLGSAVVASFNPGAEGEQVSSTLEQIFEENELAEFESILNNTREPPDTTLSGIGGRIIFEALKSISRKDTDQVNEDTAGDPRLICAGTPPVISTSVTARKPGTIAPPGRAFASYPDIFAKTGSSRFDIEVRTAAKSVVVLPGKKNVRNYTSSARPGMPRYTQMVIGVIILSLFVITIGSAFGIWNPAKILGNTSTGINGTVSNPMDFQKNSSSSIKSSVVVTATKKDIPVPLPAAPKNNGNTSNGTIKVSTTVAIQKSPPVPKTTLSSTDINRHFIQIAFGPDSTKIAKPADDRISIAMSGDFVENDTLMINEFTSQFNNLSSTKKINTGIKTGDQASIVMYFLPEASLENIEDSGTNVFKDPKTGVIHFLHRTIQNQLITKEVMYVNSDLTDKQRTHWVLRSLLYQLGFTGETYDTPDSIFYANSENTTQLSDIDLKAVGLMYGKKITTGMTFDRVKALLLIS